MERVHCAHRETAGIRLLIVDDHALVCAGLVQLFRGVSAIADLATAAGLEEAAQVGRLFQPHVVLLDASLLDAAPGESARDVVWACRDAKLILLDDSLRESHVRRALEMRAQGYWTKHVSFDQLAAAVVQVAAGQPAFCPAAQPRAGATSRPGSSTA